MRVLSALCLALVGTALLLFPGLSCAESPRSETKTDAKLVINAPALEVKTDAKLSVCPGCPLGCECDRCNCLTAQECCGRGRGGLTLGVGAQPTHCEPYHRPRRFLLILRFR